MIRLIYEKASKTKVELIRLILENNGIFTKELLPKKLGISITTLEKYLMELCTELPSNSIKFSKNQVYINKKKCSLYDVQLFYFSKSITKDILHECFFKPKVSFEKMAQNLYISTSKLFTVLKFLEKQFEKLDIQIKRTPEISINGRIENILILYNLILQSEANPYQKIHSKIDSTLIKDQIVAFFKENHINVEYSIVREFELWLLTVNDRNYLKKCYRSSIEIFTANNFIDSKSMIYRSFKKFFSQKYFTGLDNEGIILALVFLLFNTIGLHFDSSEDEQNFYKEKVSAHYSYQDFIFSLLIKEEYNIHISHLVLTALKIEGCLHYYNLLYPYFSLYGDFFNPKLRKSLEFQKLVSLFKTDFYYFIEKKFGHNLHDDIFEFFAYIISCFQTKSFSAPFYEIGIYSIKGNIFEDKLCSELKKAISILPYHQFKNTNKKLDLLIVDDLRLLNTPIEYNNYLLYEDHQSKKHDSKENSS